MYHSGESIQPKKSGVKCKASRDFIPGELPTPENVVCCNCEGSLVGKEIDGDKVLYCPACNEVMVGE